MLPVTTHVLSLTTHYSPLITHVLASLVDRIVQQLVSKHGHDRQFTTHKSLMHEVDILLTSPMLVYEQKISKLSRYLKRNNSTPIFVFATHIILNMYNHKYWNVWLLQIIVCHNNFENFGTSDVHTHWNKLRYFECWNYHHRLARPSQVVKLPWAFHYNIIYLYYFWCKIVQEHHKGTLHQ